MPRGILFHAPWLADLVGTGDWDDCAIYLRDDVQDGVPAELADSVEIVISGGEPLSNALVDALPRLRLVACFSTGYAGIDPAHLRSRGVQLTTAAGVNAHDVADHAIALLLAWWHGISAADRTLRAGGWREGLPPRPSLRGRRAGIVGLGRIGSAVAARLNAFGVAVRWWGPRPKPDAAFARVESLEKLAAESDMLVITARDAPDSAGQIDSAVLRALGPRGLLVNVARGMLIDESALREALRSGAIAGAALDVFADEPTDPALWRDVPNVVLTPHIGGYTVEGGSDMIRQLRDNVGRYLRGEPLLTPVRDER